MSSVWKDRMSESENVWMPFNALLATFLVSGKKEDGNVMFLEYWAQSINLFLNNSIFF